MTLESLINQVLNRDGSGGGESSIVALHCQQMREYGSRGGAIEFRPTQDDDRDSRYKFIQSVWEASGLEQSLDHCMDILCCRGEVLWFYLPQPDGGYYLDFFSGGLNHPDPEYKLFHGPGGRHIERFLICYSYDIERGLGAMPEKRWVVYAGTREHIWRWETTSKPDFGSALGLRSQFQPVSAYEFSGTPLAPPQEFKNPFAPALPIQVSRNNARRPGQQGSSDFHWVAGQIETHDQMLRQINENLETFAGPSLVTTRPAKQVKENAVSMFGGGIPSWSGQQRYYSSGYGSINRRDTPDWRNPRTGMLAPSVDSDRGRIAQIIGNVGEQERFGYIQPDPVSGDQNRYAQQYSEKIQWLLGGIDPLGISANATFGEIKSLFGRIENTAYRRAKALFSDGLCKVFEALIAHEEALFKKWLWGAMWDIYPELAMQAQLESWKDITDEAAQAMWELSQIEDGLPLPDDAIGLVPYGRLRVTWRYTKDVFFKTTREQLDLSIAARNQREDGLSQEWVLRQQYPNMTDLEIKNAMSGFSPRVVEAANSSIQALLQLYMQLYSIPDPVDPSKPWALALGLDQMIEQAFTSLRTELAYGRPVYASDTEESQSLAVR